MKTERKDESVPEAQPKDEIVEVPVPKVTYKCSHFIRLYRHQIDLKWAECLCFSSGTSSQGRVFSGATCQEGNLAC
jgi:hypothetical protein